MNPIFAAIPAAGRAVAMQVVRAVESGITQERAIALIRSQGFPFSVRNPWGRLLSYSRDANLYATRLKNINRNSKPNLTRLPFALGEPRRQFSWTVRVDLRDENGESWEQFLTVSTDNGNLTVQQILDKAKEHLTVASGDPDLEPEKFVLVGGRQRLS